MTTQSDVTQFVRSQVMSSMYMEENELDSEALFSSYGLESATLVRIVSAVNDQFGLDLDVKDLLPYQSVNRAAKAIYASTLTEEDRQIGSAL